MAEGASSGSRVRQRLSRPWLFEHLRVEHQVNGFLGCDYNISTGHLSLYPRQIILMVYLS
jgi:hypothetical protein